MGGDVGPTAEVKETRQSAAKDAAEGSTQAADRDDLHDEVDWGSADPASGTPDKDTESANSDCPEGGNLVQREPEPARSSNTRVPTVPSQSPDRMAAATHEYQWF